MYGLRNTETDMLWKFVIGHNSIYLLYFVHIDAMLSYFFQSIHMHQILILKQAWTTL